MGNFGEWQNSSQLDSQIGMFSTIHVSRCTCINAVGWFLIIWQSTYIHSHFPMCSDMQEIICSSYNEIKVTGGSSIEIFATNNEVVYISSGVHVSSELTRTKYSY